MINNTTLVGRLTKNPDLRYTGSGLAVVSFSLAVERNYTNAQGERETDFINCQAWRGTAETIANFAVKGSLVGITGNIQTRNYQNNEGRTIYITEVIIDNFQMLEPKNVTDQRRTQLGGGQNNNQNKNQQSNNKQQQQQNYQNNNNQNIYQNNQQNNNQSNTGQNSGRSGQSSNQSPFNNNYSNNTDPFQNNGKVDISDDDLPF